MPLPPSTYVSGPVTPAQLNADLYTFGNVNFNATGILFHSHRPLLSETIVQGGTGYAALSQQAIAGGGVIGYTAVDTTALFSPGADGPGTFAAFRFSNGISGSGGIAGVSAAGGYWLHWNFPRLGLVTNPPGGVGAGLGTGGTMIYSGSFQYGSTTQGNAPFFLDLVFPGGTTSPFWFPFFWWETASTPTITGNAIDSAGATTRQGWLWQCINLNIGNLATSIPAPSLSWGTVTSAALNSTIGSVLTFLNNPPVVRSILTGGQTVPNAVNTTMNFPAPSVDNYSGWSTALTHYSAPLPGLYLFSETLIWGTASSTGVRESILQTTLGTAAAFYKGSSYQATPVGPGVSGVGLTGSTALRIFNLNAGDSITGVGLQNSGVSMPLYTGFSSRLIGAYMSPVAATGTVITGLTVPNTGFRWQAGLLSGTALTAALNQHLGSDLQFLMNKPYFTGYQQTAQTGFASSSGFHRVTIDTIGTFPRTGNADNWAGWSTANTWYTSQLAGWYLVVADLYATPPTGTTGVLAAGIGITSSGSIVPTSAPDVYQEVAFPNTGTRAPGASAIGLYYLLPGESVYPSLSAMSWGGSWGTYVNNTSTQISFAQFSVFWCAA